MIFLFDVVSSWDLFLLKDSLCFTVLKRELEKEDASCKMRNRAGFFQQLNDYGVECIFFFKG